MKKVMMVIKLCCYKDGGEDCGEEGGMGGKEKVGGIGKGGQGKSLKSFDMMQDRNGNILPSPTFGGL